MLNFTLIEELSKERFFLKKERLLNILERALNLKTLSLEDAAYLLSVNTEEDLKLIQQSSLTLKRKVFGDRVVLFAPLYLSNECVNKCLYCGFQNGNTYEKRKTLTKQEALKEADFLVKRGFKRALLVTAENSNICGVDYITDVIRYLYERSGLRILHLNAAPMEIEELRAIKKEGVGVFQLFQETYHKETYERLHIKGRKKSFEYRLLAMTRAIEAGFQDVGIGALLGLYDYKFDVLACIAHSYFLKEHYGTFPHTISVPRFRYARGAVIESPPAPVDDITFKKIVAVYRLAVPTAGIVVSTREPSGLRDDILCYGASQISAESKTSPGGYTQLVKEEDASQFSLNDTRSLEEVIISILEKGFLPSFCTACYKKERVGENFHKLAEKGVIKDFCSKNALYTFYEYLDNLENKDAREKIISIGKQKKVLSEDLVFKGKLL